MLKQQSKEKQQFVDSLPMSKELFAELFDRLDEELNESECDHSLRITLEFLENNSISANKTVDWLKEHGGYCDCEVLANVEDLFN